MTCPDCQRKLTKRNRCGERRLCARCNTERCADTRLRGYLRDHGIAATLDRYWQRETRQHRDRAIIESLGFSMGTELARIARVSKQLDRRHRSA